VLVDNVEGESEYYRCTLLAVVTNII